MRRKLMKKKILSMMCALAIAGGAFVGTGMDTKAFETVYVDGSELTHAEQSVGKINRGTRGVHTLDGECCVTKKGKGKIYVSAATTAHHRVDHIEADLRVERYNQSTGRWGQIHYQEGVARNDYYVNTTRMLNVKGGYYYRSTGEHICGMDRDPSYEYSASITDGIWID